MPLMRELKAIQAAKTPKAKNKAKGQIVGREMKALKAGKLHSGSKKGPVVTSRKQAIAIGLSEARQAGKKKGGY